MSWLRLGPLAVHMEAPDELLPWAEPLLSPQAPATPPRWSLLLRLVAGRIDGDGTLRWRDGAYEGPGFRLHATEPGARGTLYVWVRSIARDRLGQFAFASRLHACPGCGAPTVDTFASKPCDSIVSRTASAAAHATGFPPNVLP